MNSRAAVVRGRVGEYEIQESEGIINWTRFFFLLFFIPEHRPQVKVEQMIDRGR